MCASASFLYSQSRNGNICRQLDGIINIGPLQTSLHFSSRTWAGFALMSFGSFETWERFRWNWLSINFYPLYPFSVLPGCSHIFINLWLVHVDAWYKLLHSTGKQLSFIYKQINFKKSKNEKSNIMLMINTLFILVSSKDMGKE